MNNLYNKVRPTTFDEIVGNEASINTLKRLLVKKDKPHVFLFHGSSGVGKTTVSRICAKELGASELDIKELNNASFRGIDTVREIIDQTKYAPTGSDAIVYIIDECDALTGDAQRALKKILEDTPNHVYFFLCTTKPDKIIAEIKTRCTKIQFSSLSPTKLLGLLKKVNKQEKLNVSNDALELIADNSDGSPRNALVLLEKAAGTENEKEIDEIIKNGCIDENDTEIIELARVLIKPKVTWPEVARVLKRLQESKKMDNPETVRYVILGYMNSILVSGKMMKEAAIAIEAFSNNTFDSGKAGITLACLNTIS